MGRPRTPESQRKAAGTFRQDRSDEARLVQAAQKVVVGPWLSTIPDPEFPLNADGAKKYQEVCKLLLAQNKLTVVTRMTAETFALSHQEMISILTAGKMVPRARTESHRRLLVDLGIAEAAPLIGISDAPNKFSRFGFAHRRAPEK